MKNPCVLIPSYNESKTIGGIVRNLKKHKLEVYVVDDGSTDETYRIANEAGARVIRNITNSGKGAALRMGFQNVLASDHDAVLVMDGDAQHEVADIAHLMKKMRETGAGIVIGNRMHDTSSMPTIRILVNRFMSLLLSGIVGQNIPDTQCGFRIIRRNVLENIRLSSSKYEIESEMIIRAARKGFRIESVGIKTLYEGQTSRINPFLDTLRFLALLIRMRFMSD